jgi:predicted amidohydrolase
MKKLRISFLHLVPIVGNINHNRQLVESAVEVAADNGSDWAVTPELAIPGYLFVNLIGTDWILPQPDEWMTGFCQLVRRHQLTVFLSHPERDLKTARLFNTVFVINSNGDIVGRHRKIKTLGGAETWSSPGSEVAPVECDSIQVGILICSDGYNNEVSQILKEKGAQVLVSSVSWGPGLCGPNGEWQQRSLDTGLPLMVCNRSGVETDDLDFRLAESVVVHHGKTLLTGSSDRSVVLTFNWDLDTMTPLSSKYDRAYI